MIAAIGVLSIVVSLVFGFWMLVIGLCWYNAITGEVLHSCRRKARFKYEFCFLMLNAGLYFYVGLWAFCS